MMKNKKVLKVKKPWPTKDVMQQIYDMKLWGGEEFDFYSGVGSHDSEIIRPYIEALIAFLKPFNKSLTLCDLGCGDFNIGKHLTNYAKRYVAVDIVEGLIKRNKKLFVAENIEFQCLDIVSQDLPSGDCIILRQVLQHLSNAEILQLVKKLHAYKYIIITEHLPLGSFLPNKDIITGQGIRLKKNSGVDLLASPFNLQVKEKRQICETKLANEKGRVVTILYKVF